MVRIKGLFVLSLALCLGACEPPSGQYTCPDGYTLDGAVCLPPNSDADGDGVLDGLDNCPGEPNPEQADLDGDLAGDACDLDDDADSIPDLLDNCVLVPNPGQLDLDSDGLGDACDDDDDQDGIPDAQDLCPLTWDSAQADTDGDGEGNACDLDDDGDGIPDDNDNCPVFANPAQVDSDFDGVGDLCQDDADGDGIPDGYDNCAQAPNVDQGDTDLDGEGNACDADDDGDGILDPFDNCPNAANPEQEDLDKNSIGDLCEGDVDGDGVPDEDDNCPSNANEDQADFDGDGLGDLCDDDANGDGLSDLIGGVSPATGLVAGGDRVQLQGSGFKLGATVAFDGQAAPYALVAGPERIITTTPEGTVGKVDVIVTNPDGQVFTAYDGFEYIASTEVHGLVLDSNLVPVANVLVDLTPSEGLPIQAATDATGRFELEDVPAGARLLAFNPSNAGVPGGPTYPALKVPIEVTAGRINIVGDGRPTFLPILDTSHIVQIDPSTNATVTSSPPTVDPSLEGARVEVVAGNAVDENGNPYTGEMLISEVPQNRTPQSLGPFFSPGYLVTVQPAGVEFLQPAPISMPNYAGLDPGEEWPLWGMNHDTGEFEVMGTLQVNAAGDRVETIDGGVTTSAWWPGAPGPIPPLDPDAPDGDGKDDSDGDGEDDCKAGAGSKVDFASGNLQVEHRLLTYSTANAQRGLRFVYTLQGASPRAQIRSRFGPGASRAESRANRSRVVIEIEGDVANDELLPRTTYAAPGQVMFVDNYLSLADYPTGVYQASTSVTGFVESSRGNFDVSIRLVDQPQRLLVWNARNSAVGVGWGIAEVSRLHLGGNSDSVLLVSGTGSMKAYVAPAGGVGTATSPAGDASTLDFLADGTFEHNFASGAADVYSAEGLLMFRTGPFGGTASFTYDSSFRLLDVTDEFGYTSQLSYQGSFLESVTDPGGRVTQFIHDAGGRLVSIVDPDGATRSFTYDTQDRMTTQSTPLGYTTSYSFNDELGSLESVELPDGTQRTISPNLSESSTQGIQRERLAEPSPTVPGAVLDRHEGALIDGNGNRFEFETNRLGQEVRRTGPDGATVRSEFDDNGNLTTSTLPSGLDVSYAYDSDGQNVTEISGLDTSSGQLRTVSIGYDAVSGKPNEFLYPDGTTTAVEWDAEGLPVSTTNAVGGVRTFSFDNSGKMLSTTSPMGATISWERDPVGRVTQRTDPDGYSVGRSYDSLGRLSEVVDAAGSTRSFVWNADNTLQSVTDGLGEETHFGYDAERRRTSITDPTGREIQFAFDGRDRVISRTDPLGTEHYEWSSNNEMTAYVRRNGDRNEVELDAYSRPTRKTLADGGETTYSYDLSGRLLETSNENATLTFEYDAPGHVMRETMTGAPGSGIPSSDIYYTYDVKGRRTSMITADGERSVTYVWNDLDQVTEISEGSTNVTFGYDDDGRVISTVYGGAVTESSQWSPSGRLEAQDYEVGSTTEFGWSYTYDNAGLRASRQDEDGSLRTYGYDDLGSITSVDHPGTADDESYSYDAMGNRTADHLSSAYSYDAAHRLLDDDNYLYSWTDNGELESRTDKLTSEVTSYSWDSESRLIGVTRESALGTLLGSAAYRYDPLGRRIAREVDGQHFYSVYSGRNVLQEFTSDGLPVARYVYGGLDQPLWKMDVQDAVSFFVLEGNGNVAGIVDEAGNVLERYSYDTFGNRTELLGAGLDQPLGLHARPLDPETGFYNFRRRYYAPKIGRFLCEDSFGGRISNALGMNPYVFAFNDPLRFRDPFGDFSIPFIGSGRGGVGAGGTLCFGICLGIDISFSIDSNGNFRLDVCGSAGFGIGAKGHVSAEVGAGEVSTEATIEGSIAAEATVKVGPCELGVKAEVKGTKNLSTGCTDSDPNIKGGVKCGPVSADVTVNKDGVTPNFDGPGIPDTAKASKSKGKVDGSKLDLGAGASASVEGKACIGGGASL